MNISDIHSVIIKAEDFTTYSATTTFTEIIGGTSGCSLTLNGVDVDVASSTNMKIWVKTLTGGTGCYLLGENNDVMQGGGSIIL